jgi:hypothetical protein
VMTQTKCKSLCIYIYIHTYTKRRTYGLEEKGSMFHLCIATQHTSPKLSDLYQKLHLIFFPWICNVGRVYQERLTHATFVFLLGNGNENG